MANLRIAFLLLSALALTGAAVAQEKPASQPSLITVNGNGSARVDPDMATVRLGVQSQAKTAQEAQSQASAAGQKILAAVARLGVDRKDIQTSGLSLFPIYSESRPGQTTPPSVVAYRAQNTISIRVLDLTKVGPVVDATVAAGSNEIQGVEFGLRNDGEARRNALKSAVAEARAKAEAMAEALGVSLGAIYEASEGGVQVMPLAMARGAFMDAQASTPVSPGQIDVTATVTLRYRIGR
jgi:uncharacterized protein YggE